MRWLDEKQKKKEVKSLERFFGALTHASGLHKTVKTILLKYGIDKYCPMSKNATSFL